MFFSKSLALTLIAYLAGASPWTTQAHAKDSDGTTSQKLQLTKPARGDVFVSGDTMVGEWTSSKAIVSPSIRLCAQGSEGDGDDEDGCGGTVWPEVKQDGETYSFSLMVPDVTSASDFYLRIKDDFGNIVKSPVFSLDPSATGGQTSRAASASGPVASTPKGQSGDSSGEDETSETSGSGSSSGPGSSLNSNSNSADGSSPAQAPFNNSGSEDTDSQPGSSATAASGSTPKKPHASMGSNAPATPGGTRAAADTSDGASPASVPAQGAAGDPMATGPSTGSPSTSPHLPVNASDGSISPQTATLSREGLPTAAVAVPISLVAATLVASLALCLAHRRSLAAQRARNAHLIGVQRNASVHTTQSKAPSFASAVSKSAPIVDPDIEKAIGALYGYDDKPSRHSNVRREDSVVYVPVAQRYPVPRQDVRRERTRTYERPYDSRHSYSRSHSDRYTRPPSPRPRYHSGYSRSPSEGYTHSLPTYHRRNSSIREHRYDRDDEDGCSTTDTILSGYISPQIPTPRLPRHDSYRAHPRPPPRSHSRHTAPEMEDYHYRREEDLYDAPSSPCARSYRSW